MKKIYINQIEADVNAPICIKANQDIVLGSGTVELREGSKSGKIIETFDVESGDIFISGREIVIRPKNPLPYETEVCVVIQNGVIISTITGDSFSGFDKNGDREFKFTTEKESYVEIISEAIPEKELKIGDLYENGILLSKDGGIYITASPENFEINLTWYEFSDAIKKIEQITKTAGWYVPDLYELQKYREILSSRQFYYWTSTEESSETAYKINITEGVPYVTNKEESCSIILFKQTIINY